ncbi:MAG: response regulator [Myxococcales bacterium]|nr:response regulator [Myxococcales bacterium]
MPQQPHDTALGPARQRFVDSLPKKASELRGALALLVGSPESARPRDDFRARLQALYASAQVFRMAGLVSALSEGVHTLEAARDEARPVTQSELDELTHLVATLPSLADGGAAVRPSMVAPPSTASVRPSAAPAPIVHVGSTPPGPLTTSITAPPVSARPPARPHKPTMMGFQPPPGLRAPAPPSVGSGSAQAPAPPAPRPKVPTVASREAEVIPVKPPAPFTTTSPASVGPPRPTGEPPPSTTSAGGYSAPVQSIVSALVCTDTASEALIRAALPPERFEVLTATTAEEATQLAWTSAPDLILADATLCMGPNGLLARLRRDALTDFVPVVVLFQPGVPVDAIALRQAGAVDSLRKPLLMKTILQTVHRVADLGEAATWAPLGDLTVNDVAERIAAEIRRGLVLSADRGPDVAVPLGDGSEVLAAAWAAIARVRAHLSERSSGRVHFRDPAGRRGPSLVSLHDLEPTAEEEARDSATEAEISLRGRRVIVADDDPAVRWFFAQLLEEEGAHVVQAEDGVVALAAARAEPPDVIVSDILMPNMDGLALCRALSRDPSVSETPVILLSWREDFLSRMRELRAGARGYLRKEAESTQILAKVREVLRARAQFEARLRAGGAVRGRVEGLGIPCLLSTVQREREHALLTVRDAFNLFEVEIQDRQIVSVSSTATDGGFSRGDRALRVLAGVTTGRFAIEELDPSVRHSMAGGAPRVSLAEACARLGALIDSVSGEALANVDSLGLDEDALDSFQASAPGEVGAVAAALSAGQTPRQLLVSSVHAPQAVEAALIELARRGVILGVRDAHGVDLVATSLSEREEALAHSHAMAEEADGLPLDDEPVLLVPAQSAPAHAEPVPLMPSARAPETEPVPLVQPPVALPLEGQPSATDAAYDSDDDEDGGHEDDSGEYETDASREPREGFGPLTWFAMLFMLAAVGYVGYMMIVESNRGGATEPADGLAPAVEGADEGEGAEGVDPAPTGTEDDGAAPEGQESGAADPSAPVEDGLTFGTLTPGVRLEGGRVPEGHGVLHVLAGGPPGVVVAVGEQVLGAPPQQVALPEGRHTVFFRHGSTTVQRFYFVRGGHTRVVPVPES